MTLFTMWKNTRQMSSTHKRAEMQGLKTSQATNLLQQNLKQKRFAGFSRPPGMKNLTCFECSL